MDQKTYPFSAGNHTMSDLLGDKGANLAEPATLGIPLPKGFRITTRACEYYLTTYVSCSLFWVLVARLQAGRAAVSIHSTTGSV